MGIFGQSSPFDADVEKATSQTNTNDNWSFILDVCDKVTTNPRSAKDCLKSIMKRMGHPDPHVVMQAITLLDACANNCGKPFHLEIASREFETEFRRLLSKAQPKVSVKMRQVLKNWAENDFKNDSELNLIPSFYIKLRSEGFDFSNLNEKPIKTTSKSSLPKDPNVVSSQQEEDDIAKAIELSLKETSSSPNHQGDTNSGRSGAENNSNPSLYPSFGSIGDGLGTLNSAGAVDSTSQQEPRKVRALYDFEAAEENELTFFSGEIIHVVDDTDPNWWKGLNQRGEGLFPSNFVTADLSVDPDRLDINQQHSSFGKEDANISKQQKTDTVSVSASELTEINESKIDRLLHLLHEANPEDPSQDSDELLSLEKEVHRMGPLIDSELERVDRKHAQLTQLSSDLVDAINLYHSLMRDDCNAQYCHVGGSLIGNTPGLSYQGVYNVGGYLSDPVVYPLSQKTSSTGMHSLPYTGELHQHNNFNGTATSNIRYPVQVGQSNSQYQNAMQLNSLQAQMISQGQHHQGVAIQSQIYGETAPVSSQHQNKTNFQGFHLDQHHNLQQQPQQFPPQISTISEPTSTVQNVTASPNLTMIPQQSNLISSQNPQQAPVQYIAGQQMPIQTSPYSQTLPNTVPTFLAQTAQRNNDNSMTTIQPHVNINSFSGNGESQIQHQMAAPSIGFSQSTSTAIAPIQSSLSAGIAAPSQQNFLLQNEIKDNIAIYQQQR